MGRISGIEDISGFRARGWDTFVFHSSTVSDRKTDRSVDYGPTILLKNGNEKVFIGFGKMYVGGWATEGVSPEERVSLIKGLVSHLKNEGSVVFRAG
jgi:hypothetical protein